MQKFTQEIHTNKSRKHITQEMHAKNPHRNPRPKSTQEIHARNPRKKSTQGIHTTNPRKKFTQEIHARNSRRSPGIHAGRNSNKYSHTDPPTQLSSPKSSPDTQFSDYVGPPWILKHVPAPSHHPPQQNMIYGVAEVLGKIFSHHR
jgi:hypothetical protein